MPKAPPVDTRYLMREAAAYFHVGGISGMLNQPVEYRAEMIAHMMIKSVRDDYVEYQRQKLAKEAKRDSASFNPADAIRRQWML